MVVSTVQCGQYNAVRTPISVQAFNIISDFQTWYRLKPGARGQFHSIGLIQINLANQTKPMADLHVRGIHTHLSCAWPFHANLSDVAYQK